MAERKDFLLEMYKQLCAEMDRHIKATWQILGVLLSTFAVFALIEKKVISPDIAVAIIIAVCELSIAIIIESNFWYNRNLVMVANIERQFLNDDDAEKIHYYFLEHRENNAYLDMMVMQIIFVFIILLIVLLYHFLDVILPFLSPKNPFDFVKMIPYAVTIGGGIWLYWFHRKRRTDYNDFKRNSPGKDMTEALKTHRKPSNSDHPTA